MDVETRHRLLRTAEVMMQLGCVQGKFPSCLYFHLVNSIYTWVHGDDFVSLIPRSQVTWLTSELGNTCWWRCWQATEHASMV